MRKVLIRLVRLYPAAFRAQFGADVEHQLVTDFDAARRRGPAAAAWLGLRAAVNVIASAALERWRPTWFDGAISPNFLQETSNMRRFLDGWRQDLRHAARGLRRAPAFSAVTIGTLALAIGLTVAMFSVVNAVLLRPLPYGDASRLLFITGEAPGSDITGEFGVASEFHVHFRERAKAIDGFATFSSFTSTMRANERVERIRMAAGNSELFEVLGVAPQVGRLPSEADRDTVALISDDLWTSWFDRDPSVIGRTYQISGADRTIVGVMPEKFGFPTDATLVWFPIAVDPAAIVPGQFGAGAVARMKRGMTIDQVARELTALAHELPGRFGGSPQYARLMQQYRIVARPLADQMFGPVAEPLWVLFAGAAIVLVIACANVANLFMVRSEGRLREMALRQAVGAERSQLLRVQLSESLLVAGAAGAAAVALAAASLPVLLRAVPANVPRIGDTAIGPPAMAFAALTAFFVALACGLAPALRASRPKLMWLREGGRGATRRHGWGRNALVVAQTALALVLLIGSGLLLRSYARLSTVHRGYDVDDIFTFQIAPEQPSLDSGPAAARFALGFMDRLRALPGVDRVGLVENVPLDEGTASASFRADGAPADSGARLSYTFSAGDYFEALGIRLLAGRPFSNDDATGMRGNVVISRSAATALWPGQDAIGRRLQRVGSSTWETVIGVVDDVMQEDFRAKPNATVYLPMSGHTPTQYRLMSPGYVVKTSRAESIAPEIRAIVQEIAPEAPMYRAYTMEFLARRELGSLSFTMLALGLVSSMALILGALGLYGVLSYVVAERTPEIGVRIALGAAPGGVRWMVVAQGLKVVAIGIVIGVGAAVVATRALGTLLFGVEALDTATFAVMSVSMLIVGLVASYIPAHRASAVDPIQSLR